jgi:thiamine-phosphate pyrophosphorylase
MKLMVLTSSPEVENEVIYIKQMLDAGLPTLHLRKPTSSIDYLKKVLDGLSSEHHKKILLHTHYGLLWDYNLKGIHLSKADRQRKYKAWLTYHALKLRRPNILRSTSCSSISTLAESYNAYDYIMLTPVFTGVQEHRPTFSRGTLKVIAKKYPERIIARGGASANNIEKAVEIGFNGIAFHNSIWKNPEPVKEFERIINRYKELGLPIE